MKKIAALLACAILILSAGGFTPAYAQDTQLPFEVRTEGVYMENLETGQVIAEKNADMHLAPASLTKIMTAILTLENVEDLDNESAYLKVYLNDMIYGKNASTGGFWPGDKASIKEILAAALIQSAAECALMLADYVGDGSVGHFVDMMNQRAKELGCTNTNFVDPHGLAGLDEGQYTTARDMAILTRHAMTFPVFAELVSSVSYPVSLQNRQSSFNELTTNRMLKPSDEYYYAPIQGIKTGTLSDVRCFVSQAKSDGYSYLLVLLGAPTREADGTATTPAILTFHEAKLLYQWAFDSFSVRTAVERGEEVVEIPVKYSMQGDFVRLATSQQYTALLHKDIDVGSILYQPDIPEYLVAPIEKGQEIGRLKLIYMEEELGSVPLVTTTQLTQSRLLALAGWFSNELHTYRMKFLIVFAVLIVILYAALIFRAQNLRRRSGKYSSYRSGDDKNYHI